ncbi:hypothetical protein KQX54_014659 [Cotesia glomerata]|uniref:Uncharacterized protein n=1 Tax=Cotesia glomerata TaxID=32391 RepID=A0AAV7J4E1_COTGL|nr:hypothetical protein KQX54_014659 [Cotesia glomerata]
MKPESFTVYGMLSDRTNNHQESFHRNINKLVAAHSHTNVFINAKMITGITLEDIVDKLENLYVIKNLKNYVFKMTDHLDDSTDEDVSSEEESNNGTSEEDSSEEKENDSILHI